MMIFNKKLLPLIHFLIRDPRADTESWSRDIWKPDSDSEPENPVWCWVRMQDPDPASDRIRIKKSTNCTQNIQKASSWSNRICDIFESETLQLVMK